MSNGASVPQSTFSLRVQYVGGDGGEGDGMLGDGAAGEDMGVLGEGEGMLGEGSAGDGDAGAEYVRIALPWGVRMQLVCSQH